jgi:hypothetical protein
VIDNISDKAELSAVVQFAEAMKAMNEPLAAWAEKYRRAFGAMTEAARRPIDTATATKRKD